MTFRYITATFNPKKTDDLRPELVPVIGKEVSLGYAGTGMDDEPYPGQHRYYGEDTDGYWVPECDLDNIKEVKK
jgi:hypothetical protein